MPKSGPKTVPFSCLSFKPRFEYGDVCFVAETVGEGFGGELGTGFARMTNARIPWTVRYDEVLTVFEGRLKVHTNGTIHDLGPKDSLWIPNGTELVYEAEDCLVHYAIHPVKF
jgi:ethanolamine utilization protein EutQ